MTDTAALELELGPHLLGRNPSPPDARDWRLMAAIEREDPAPLWPDGTRAEWRNPVRLSQGDTPHCVGGGWTHWEATDPVLASPVDDDLHALYYLVKELEGEPRQENGAWVRSGAQVQKQRGRLDAYAFAQDVDEVITWVRSKGSLVVGTLWTDDMFEPDANGYVRPTGANAGGHCYLVRGDIPNADGSRGSAILDNTWSEAWGVGGSFYMTWDDLATLMDDYGEIVTAVELPRTV